MIHWQTYYHQNKHLPLGKIMEGYQKLLQEYNERLLLVTQNTPPPSSAAASSQRIVYPLSFGILYSLAGANSPTSIRFNTKINNTLVAGQELSYVVSTNSNPSQGSTINGSTNVINSFLDTGSIVSSTVTGLTANTTYYYWLYDNRSDNYLSSSINTESYNYTYLGKFKTLPTSTSPYAFSASYGSCMQSLSTSTIFNKISEYNPNFFIHMGDIFYWDDATEPDYLNERESSYQSVFASGSEYIKYPGTYATPNYFPYLIRNTTFDYVWDDHDYGNNNSDSTNVNKGYASQAVEALFPNYDFPSTSSIYQSASVDVSTKAINHKFTAGRIKFIVTDNRSQRSPYTDTDNSSKIIWSQQQEDWFMNEMKDTAYPVKIWVNSFPWEGNDSNPLWTGDDGWEKYTTYRSKIANFFTANSSSIGKIIILSGDAHMTSIDDGTLSPWYGSGSKINPPITIHQSAPLDQGGSRKGGPYVLNGADIWQNSSIIYQQNDANYSKAITGLTSSYITSNNRYGCMEVQDDLSTIKIDLYSRSGNTTITSSAGDQRFPSVNGDYKKFRITLNTSNYISGSGGSITETRSFV
jgi:hypothetical protein